MAKFTDFQLRVFEKPQLECPDVVSLLGDYEDNDLPAALRGRITEHLDECDYCSEVEDGYRLTMDLAREPCSGTKRM